jgi:hypothetical protein
MQLGGGIISGTVAEILLLKKRIYEPLQVINRVRRRIRTKSLDYLNLTCRQISYTPNSGSFSPRILGYRVWFWLGLGSWIGIVILSALRFLKRRSAG